MNRLVVFSTAVFLCAVFLCAAPCLANKTATVEPEVDFSKDVQPILAKRCFSCHGPDEAEGGLRFTDRESAIVEGDTGEWTITVGNAATSHLMTRILADEDSEWDRMPPEGDPLSDEEIDTIRRWIDQGAVWKKHWAFEPIGSPEIPHVQNADWSEHPIDAFIYKALADAELEPSEPADRRTLIRRAYYDLLGLPPTAEQINAFVADPDPQAYQRLIDDLLESPHYGERWGRHWLDLVRYAETNSFERDGAKPNAWKYRDYVIRSFNEDKPYDQFVREQLAGDELDQVTTESLTATGFYRLGIWDDEPADPKQAHFDEMDDIITTVGQGFLGLTINCARCHDHKIDPIPQKDYYSMLAFFADVTTYGTRGDQRSNNQIDVSKPAVRDAYDAADQSIARLEKRMLEIEQAGIAKMDGPDQRATEGAKRDRLEVLKAKLQDHLEDDQWSEYQQLKIELTEAKKAKRSLPERQLVLGLAKYPAQARPTHVLYRGSPHSPTDEVQIAFPEIFETEDPQNQEPTSASVSLGRRKLLADWICDPENRLASRVIVNRIWQFHFGRGIVRSSNNFGQLGVPPTHPLLLDWLANRLVDGGWRLKPMHRLIMNSRAYQQSSRSRPEGEKVDPGNDLFWRFDPRRLSAEEVRDSMLLASGTLNSDLYGPSVYPKLSKEVMQGQSKPGLGWGKSDEASRNRRSVYIHVKRSLLTPMMTAFDFPDPDRSCEARFMTLQPGQALALLNSEFAHEQAIKLANSIDAGDIDDEQVVQRSVQAVLGRDATQEEVDAGAAFIQTLQQEYSVDRDRATQLHCLAVMNWNEFLFLD